MEQRSAYHARPAVVRRGFPHRFTCAVNTARGSVEVNLDRP
jgi:hypothetical protein